MTTTISATASVRVRGSVNSPEAAAAVASVLGSALGSAMRSTQAATTESRRKRVARPAGD